MQTIWENRMAIKKINRTAITLAAGLVLSAAALFAQDDGTYRQYMLEGYTYDEIEEAEQAAAASADVDSKKAVMSSVSKVDWSKSTFTSDITLDTVKAGIPMPSGKAVSMNRVQMELPVLVKDPLLSLYADDTRTLGDLVLEGNLTLDALTRIIDGSKKTPPYFMNATNTLKTTNTLDLHQIGALLVKHRTPYVQDKPIERISSKAYTGIVIDARGLIPVQGEHVKSEVYPCLFPKIWNEDMDLIYERNMVLPDVAKSKGIVDYLPGQGSNKKTERAGNDPLWITARKVYGVNRCDQVISKEDYLRITTVPANLELLKQGKVVILLDSDKLVGNVTSPRKDIRYYLETGKLKQRIDKTDIPDVTPEEHDGGFVIRMENLRFIADLAELLPEEKHRVAEIAKELKTIIVGGKYTIRVNGHTADVNKPLGQQALSIERAEAIKNALVAEGIPENLFTCYGYGGTMPIADNSTASGRAQNRRVEIEITPQGTEIQRR